MSTHTPTLPTFTDTKKDDSQYTYVYETLSQEALYELARKVLGEDCSTLETPVILERLRNAPQNEASQMAPTRQSSSVSSQFINLFTVSNK